jgi:hypothetical protein
MKLLTSATLRLYTRFVGKEAGMTETEELTLVEAARELGLSRQRLAVLAKEGRLGRQVAGRYWVFTPREVEAFKPQVKSSKGGRPKEIAGTLARAVLA